MYNNNNDKSQKFPGKKLFAGFKLTVFEDKRTFMKKAVLHTTTLMHCKAWQALCDPFSTNQGNGSEIRFAAGGTKINFKNLKT